MWGSGSGGSSRKKSRGKSSSTTSSSSSSSSSSSLNQAAMEKLFNEICDPDDPSIATMEGISKLCESLHIDPMEDLRILVLLWKMDATEKPAQISRKEWMNGCQKLQVDSIAKFQSILPSLDIGFMDQSDFKDFYKFCFQFNRQGTHRTLDKDLVTALLHLVLNERIAGDRLSTFISFLESAKGYTRITLDQWVSFLDFCYECEDLSTYDEANSAWPVLIDEYVEYMEQQARK
eukprot:CAMPEP_0116566758 /NCGR_PEP_ID=MMETSP0397-20121206/14629_1 /TAXON_ID=216820 /ORGANISM="Cyclophora tenuis, Strain ECT3854" /LENGTH=232 /DNA_ID=CAMNT_0004093673 /DNA_START=180 /DNA_END=878 /DNA_ORIENTATION=-